MFHWHGFSEFQWREYCADFKITETVGWKIEIIFPPCNFDFPIRRSHGSWMQRPPEAVLPLTVYGLVRFLFWILILVWTVIYYFIQNNNASISFGTINDWPWLLCLLFNFIGFHQTLLISRIPFTVSFKVQTFEQFPVDSAWRNWIIMIK